MITLAIETSCDETAVSILSNDTVKTEVIASSASAHSKFGGVVPEVASRRHLEAVLPCVQEALKKARIKLEGVDLVAATGGPGLMGALLVGVSAAKSIALAAAKPLVFVDHVLAHAFAGQFGRKKPVFPFLALVVSGGHTLLICWKSQKSYEVIGHTTDDAAGEAFDKVANLLNWPYPGGPEIDRRCVKRTGNLFDFPRPRLREPGYDFSFSGLKTAVYYKLLELEKEGKLTASKKTAVASSFQEAVCEVLVAKTMKAANQYKPRFIAVGGGVSANSRLRELFAEATSKSGPEAIFPDMKICVDNASMIGFLAYWMYKGRLDRLASAAQRKRSLQFKPYPDFYSAAVC